MYPPILMMQPEMGKMQLKIRVEHLQEALDKAKNYTFKGAMFPWESAFTGNSHSVTFDMFSCNASAFVEHM